MERERKSLEEKSIEEYGGRVSLRREELVERFWRRERIVVDKGVEGGGGVILLTCPLNLGNALEFGQTCKPAYGPKIFLFFFEYSSDAD